MRRFLPNALCGETIHTIRENAVSTSKDLADYMIRQAMDAGITNPRELAIFMGQVSAETDDLRSLEENLNYSSRGLRDTFPGVWTAAQADAIVAGGPRSIGNAMYGGRLGNNNENDGYDFRGRGYLQLTGRENYEKIGRAIGVDLTTNPDVAADPEVAAKIAVHYWQTKVRAIGAENDVYAASRAVNGGSNGLDHRIQAAGEWEQKFANGYLNSLSTNPPPINGLRDGILGPGETGQDVVTLQKALNQAINAGLTTDGDYGPGTERAVREFQQKNGLTVTGVAGPETLKALGIEFPQQTTPAPQPTIQLSPTAPTGATSDMTHQTMQESGRATPVAETTSPTTAPATPTLTDTPLTTTPPTATPPGGAATPPSDTPAAPEVNAGRILPPTGFGTWPSPGNYEPNPPIIGDPRYDTPRGGKLDGHAGIDIKGDIGDPVVAFKAGVVDPIGGIGYDRNAGWFIQIKHDDGTYTMYQHLKDEPKLQLGQPVKEGEKIAEVGQSGNADGVPQLHFEVRKGDGGFNTDVNPSEFVQHKGSFGPVVSELQQLMTDQGYYKGPINGVFGDQMTTAVKDWQKANGLEQTGAVDGNALEAIRHPEKYRAAPTQTEQPQTPTAPGPSPQPPTIAPDPLPPPTPTGERKTQSVEAMIAELPIGTRSRELLQQTNAVVNTLPTTTFDSPDQQLRASAAILGDRLNADKGVPQAITMGTKNDGTMFLFESKDPAKDPNIGFSVPDPMNLNDLKNRSLGESLQRIAERAGPESQISQAALANTQINPTQTNTEIEKSYDQKPKAFSV